MTTTVFTLHDTTGAVKFVGTTTTSPVHRVQMMLCQARSQSQPLYSTRVGAWLRELQAAGTAPTCTTHGEFELTSAAATKVSELKAAAPFALNSGIHVPTASAETSATEVYEQTHLATTLTDLLANPYNRALVTRAITDLAKLASTLPT